MTIQTYDKYIREHNYCFLRASSYDYFMENEIYEYILDTIGYPVGMSFFMGCVRIPVLRPSPHMYIEHADWNVGYTPVKYGRRTEWYQDVLNRLEGNMKHEERRSGNL